jgi:hypothetical protein
MRKKKEGDRSKRYHTSESLRRRYGGDKPRSRHWLWCRIKDGTFVPAFEIAGRKYFDEDTLP